MTAKEIAEAVAAQGNVQSGDIRVSSLRPDRGGLNTGLVFTEDLILSFDREIL